MTTSESRMFAPPLFLAPRSCGPNEVCYHPSLDTMLGSLGTRGRTK